MSTMTTAAEPVTETGPACDWCGAPAEMQRAPGPLPGIPWPPLAWPSYICRAEWAQLIGPEDDLDEQSGWVPLELA